MNLNEEWICGHLVTERDKKVWNVELNILKEVKRICEKHNIKYFAEGGTLLGAARHGGFIPWDDDIDVAMLRDDYNKFIEIAQSELPEHLFIQNSKTDIRPNLFTKIRDSRTTWIPKGNDLKLKNYGIFIDIFPLDGCDNNIEQIRNDYFKLDLAHNELAFKELNNKYKDYLTIYALNHLYGMIRPASVYNEMDYLQFCDIEVPVPKDYEIALDWHYKNWKTEYVIGGQNHSYKVIDPDNSFKEYMKWK